MHRTAIAAPRPAPPLPAVPIGRLSLPAALLTAIYVTALAIAVTAPREQAVAGLVVLAGLTVRMVARRHRCAARHQSPHR